MVNIDLTSCDMLTSWSDQTVRQRELAEAMVRERKEGHAITQRAGPCAPPLNPNRSLAPPLNPAPAPEP